MTETLTAPPAPVDEDTGGAANRKPLLIAGGLVAVLALAGGGYLLLGGGSSSDASLAPIARGVPKAAAPAAAKPAAKAAAKAAKPTALLPAATTVALGRDPFIPLYVQPAAPAAGAATATTTTPTTAPATTTSTGSTSTASTGGTTTLATAAYGLKLVSITKVTGTGRTYMFSYGGASKGVLEGQRFGKYGEITVLGVTTKAPNDTATGAIIQVGDDEPFTVMIGETVTVK